MRRKASKDWSNWVIAGFFVATFAGSKIYDSFAYKELVVTRPVLDDRSSELKKYTDEKAALVLERAMAHSDTERQNMLLKLQEMTSEAKQSNAKLEGKMDALFNLVQSRTSGHPKGL